MITYNHEKYIAQAIDSVLMQKTDFAYELVIGDDCSTDSTRSIVKDYASGHPDRICLMLHERNLGLMGKNNFVATLKACRGLYIAMLEGDDFWTDPYKLQKQVDFLEAHAEFALCGHWVRNADAAGNSVEKHVCTGELCPEVFGVEHALGGTPVHTGSWVFRRSAVQPALSHHLELYERLPAGDDPLLLLILTQGQGRCLQEFMGVYRLCSGGVWSQRSKLEKNLAMLQFYYALPRLLADRHADVYRDAIRRQIMSGESRVARSAAYSSNLPSALRELRRMGNRGLVPRGRVSAIAARVPLYVAARIARYPRIGAGRVLRKLGLR
jgi:glycosyltransferase involved in cell wall biosynthesis